MGGCHLIQILRAAVFWFGVPRDSCYSLSVNSSRQVAWAQTTPRHHTSATVKHQLILYLISIRYISWWGDMVPRDNLPRDNVPRDNVPQDNPPPRQCAPETICPETICPGDYPPRRQHAPETTCPGRQHAPETTCPGDYMPRDNVPRRHHAPETIRPGFKIHYQYSTMLG